MKSSFFFLLFSSGFFMGCGGAHSVNEGPVEEQFFANKAKWESQQENLSGYEITHRSSSMGGYTKSTVIYRTGNNSPDSCLLETRDWNQQEPVFSDCLADSQYHRDVDGYFDSLSDVIATYGINSIEYDKDYGVPLSVVGVHPMPLMADAPAPGFQIEFTPVE